MSVCLSGQHLTPNKYNSEQLRRTFCTPNHSHIPAVRLTRARKLVRQKRLMCKYNQLSKMTQCAGLVILCLRTTSDNISAEGDPVIRGQRAI